MKHSNVTTAVSALRIPMIESVSRGDQRAIVVPYSMHGPPSAKQSKACIRRKICLALKLWNHLKRVPDGSLLSGAPPGG